MQCVTLDFEDIAELYWHREMTVNEIANELGIPSAINVLDSVFQ